MGQCRSCQRHLLSHQPEAGTQFPSATADSAATTSYPRRSRLSAHPPSPSSQTHPKKFFVLKFFPRSPQTKKKKEIKPWKPRSEEVEVGGDICYIGLWFFSLILKGETGGGKRQKKGEKACIREKERV